MPGLPNWEPFLEAVQAGADCAVVDIGYYRAEMRTWLESQLPGISIEYRCFENDLAAAEVNCRKDAAAGRRAPHLCEQNVAMVAALERGELSVPDGVEFMKIRSA